MVVVSIAIVLFSLLLQLARLGFSHLEAKISVGAGLATAALLALVCITPIGREIVVAPSWSEAPAGVVFVCVLGAIGGTLLFLPALRISRCFADINRAGLHDAGTAASLVQGSPLSHGRRALQVAAFLAPLAIVALWSKPLLGGVLPPVWILHAFGGDKSILDNAADGAGGDAGATAAAVGMEMVAQQWRTARILLTGAAAILQLLALRTNVQVTNARIVHASTPMYICKM